METLFFILWSVLFMPCALVTGFAVVMAVLTLRDDLNALEGQ